MNWFRDLKTSLQWLKNPYAYLDKCAAQEDRLSFVRKIPIMGKTLFTGEPELTEEIMRHSKLESGSGIVALRSVLGEGSLIMLDGEEHQLRKKIIQPLFKGPQLKKLDQMFYKVAKRKSAEIDGSRPFPVYKLLHSISLEAISRFMFGEEDEVLLAEAIEAIDKFLFSFSSPLLLFLKPLQIDLGPFSPWGKFIRIRSRLRELCRAQIQNALNGSVNDGIIAQLAHNGKDVPEEILITEILTLLMFGHDTGASTMTWGMALIHSHPKVLEKLREEIHDSEKDGEVDFENLTYMKACLNESMRMRPVVVHLTRVVTDSINLGGFSLKKGDRVAPSAWLAHHNSKHWEEPLRFDPQRFLGKKPQKFTWYPFGIGQRICIGMPFVQRQMPSILAGILHTLNLELAPGYELQPVRQMVLMTPKKGCPMIVRRTALLSTQD